MYTLFVRALAVLSLIGLVTTHSAAQQYRIDTIAGQPAPVNVSPTSTFLQAPQGLAFDAQGNLYIAQADASILSIVSAANGNISTFAGTGISYVSSGFGGPASSASFQALRYVALDPSGNIFLTEFSACTIDRIDAVTKIVTVYAGISGSCGYSGDGGPATSAQLSANTRTIALDSGGNLYIADVGNGLVRRVDATTHIITIYAGGGSGVDGGPATSIGFRPFALAFDASDNLYIGAGTLIHVVNKTTQNITRFAGAGPQSPVVENAPALSANIGSVRGLAFDAAGNLYFTDSFNLRLRKIDTSVQHLVTTVAGTGLSGYSGDGGPATSAQFTDLEGVALDSGGNIYVSDFTAHVVRKVSGTTISTYAGGDLGPDNTAPTSAFLNFPQDVAVDASGNVLVSDGADARIRKINPALTNIQTIAGLGYSANSGNGGLATNAGLAYGLQGVALDPFGNLYLADFGNFEVRKIDLSGNITVFAGNGTQGYSGDGGLATEAELSNPQGIAVDSTGAVYISDLNSTIRRVDVTGHISTFAGTGDPGFSPDGTPAAAAQLNGQAAIEFDSANNLYIADYGNSMVRVIRASDGKIYTVAGNGTIGYTGDGQIATTAQLNGPQGLAVNANGDVFIADGGNSAIRLVTAANGRIQTIAGTGVPGYSGDGGNASGAQIRNPIGLALDSNGRLLVVDNGNNVIRRLAPKIVPTITWSAPSAISYGTPLSATQLNATANVPGTFVYNPPAGTVLAVGNGQTLSVTFTPGDAADYSSTTMSVSINVTASVPVHLNSATSPNSGIAGTSIVFLTGSGFPAGSVTPGQITISVGTGCLIGTPILTTAASYTHVTGTSYRLGFQIPGGLANGTYFVSIAGPGFVSSNCSQLGVTVPLS